MIKREGRQYQAKKQFGQHFLINASIIDDILQQIYGLQPPLPILEIGPGPGVLTLALHEHFQPNFLAVEIDVEKVQYLQKNYPQLTDHLLLEDFLNMRRPFDGQQFNLVGNFPYNISSQILFKVLEWRDQVQQVVGMFQKEVAKRIAAGPHNKDYGILSVLCQMYYEVSYLFDVPADSFDPPPKVVSGVLKMTRIQDPEGVAFKKLLTLVKMAFSQRRKTLRNCLKPLLDAEALSDVYFNQRAEQLTVQDYLQLYKKIYG